MRSTVKRRLICLLAAILLCAQLSVSAFAAAPPARSGAGQTAAEELYALGLFQGSGRLPDGSPDFELDRSPTRAEALVMLVRLLGAEEEALSGRYSHPFTDADWADAYIGYAYENGISNGISDTEYGAYNEATLAQFLTFVLRALGYGDVDWRNPYPTAGAAGLYYPAGEGFYRADVALICLDALDCQIRGQSATLRDKLIASGAVDAKRGSQPLAIFVPGPVAPLVTEFTVSNQEEFFTRLAEATQGHAEEVLIHVPGGQALNYYQALKDLFDAGPSQPFTEANGYMCVYSPGDLTYLKFIFNYSDAALAMAWLEGRRDSPSNEDTAAAGDYAKYTVEDARMLEAARAIHASLAAPGMSEYDQVKAFHDWLVNNTEYSVVGDHVFDAAGPLLYGRAACDGYAKAFDLLCYLSGIECLRVSGKANGGNHGWNIVKVDGQWYNIDVTWDDPVSSVPVLRYDYFLVSDSTLAKDHQWTAFSFWPTAPYDYGR